jgi:ribosomal protein L37AE/L43A
MNLNSYVSELDLEEGRTYRGDCPVCGRKNTFTAKNDMGKLIWNCYSYHCKTSGGSRTNLTVEDIKKLMLKQDTEHEQEPFSLPPYVVVDYTNPHTVDLCDAFGLNAPLLDLRYDIKESRVVFPVYQKGLIIDAVGRAKANDPAPKWKRYGKARTAYVRGVSPVAVVVEDAISAAVVETLGGTGFALLGTQLLDEHIQMLRCYDRVVVALDPDAGEKTIRYKRELFSNNIDSYAMNLYDDLKYRTLDDIETLKKLIAR